METSVRLFDTELLQLCHQKLSLDRQLKLLELHLLTVCREVLLLRQFQPREEVLQEKLKGCIQEEKIITVTTKTTRTRAGTLQYTEPPLLTHLSVLRTLQLSNYMTPSSAPLWWNHPAHFNCQRMTDMFINYTSTVRVRGVINI